MLADHQPDRPVGGDTPASGRFNGSLELGAIVCVLEMLLVEQPPSVPFEKQRNQ